MVVYFFKRTFKIPVLIPWRGPKWLVWYGAMSSDVKGHDRYFGVPNEAMSNLTFWRWVNKDGHEINNAEPTIIVCSKDAMIRFKLYLKHAGN